MKKITKETFEKFHKEFLGDTALTFQICTECGGTCEYNKISSLLPGEIEYMASKKNIDIEQYRNAYFDGIEIEGEIIDIIKCSDPCPFLNKDYSCDIKSYKPIMCLIYPIIFEPNGQVWKFLVDDVCPLSKNTETRSYFENTGSQLVEELQISAEWIRRVYLFDEYDYDYKKMVSNRDEPINKYKIYTLEELLSYRIFDNHKGL